MYSVFGGDKNMSKKTIPVNYEIPGYSDEINYEIFNNPIIST